MIRMMGRHREPDDDAKIVDATEDEANDTVSVIHTEASDSGAAPEPDPEDSELGVGQSASRGSNKWRRAIAFGLLPALALALAAGAALLKWQNGMADETQTARIESVQAATDGTVKILSYGPDTVDADLASASDRLTGEFRDSYTKLTHDVVIPGAKQKKISAVANVPAATSVSATPTHAVVMVFINQTVIVGNDAPSSTSSTVRVTLDKRDNRWLISDFTPI